MSETEVGMDTFPSLNERVQIQTTKNQSPFDQNVNEMQNLNTDLIILKPETTINSNQSIILKDCSISNHNHHSIMCSTKVCAPTKTKSKL